MSNNNERLFSLVEHMPAELFYIPYVPYFLYLMLRYRGTMLAELANTSIIAGGLSGESKQDLYNLLGKTGRKYHAPFVSIVAGQESAEEAEKKMAAAKLSFPIVAKPDIGRNGRGVKVVNNVEELATHIAKFPKGARLLLQHYVRSPREAGIFYVRLPSEEHGRITSLTLKFFPEVVGDGVHTVRELILEDPRARVLKEVYFRRNQKHLERKLAKGEVYKLVSVGNHVRGSRFENGAPHITTAMLDIFEKIALEMPGFYFGRFDVRFDDLEALKQGQNFSIIEYNGASSEPTHVWDRTMSIGQVYRDMFEHWRLAFAIGSENRARGYKQLGVFAILKRYFDEIALIKTYPDEE